MVASSQLLLLWSKVELANITRTSFLRDRDGFRQQLCKTWFHRYTKKANGNNNKKKQMRGRATKLCTRLINKCVVWGVALETCLFSVSSARSTLLTLTGYVGFSFLMTSKASWNTETGMLFRCITARDKNALKESTCKFCFVFWSEKKKNIYKIEIH